MRLGTLTEYRKNENAAIRDEYEGTYKVILRFPEPTKIDMKALQRVTMGTSPTLSTIPISSGESKDNVMATSFAGYHTSGSLFCVDQVTVWARSDNDITLEGSVTLHAEGADAWLLCLSESDVLGSTIPDAGYNSAWSIQPNNVFEFAKRLAIYMRNSFYTGTNNRATHFTDETIGPFRLPAFRNPPRDNHMNFFVLPEIWKVNYQTRNIRISSGISDSVVQKAHSRLDQCASIKPNTFSHEQEVRIVFRPTMIDSSNGKRYFFSNYLNPILVPFDELMGFVSVKS